MLDCLGRTMKNLQECADEIQSRGGKPLIVQMDHDNDKGNTRKARKQTFKPFKYDWILIPNLIYAREASLKFLTPRLNFLPCLMVNLFN